MKPTVTFTMAAPHVAKIMLNRPDARNAQNDQLTYELNACFDRAAHDDDVKVILLGGEGPHFSSGHDLRGKPTDAPRIGTWGQPAEGGIHGLYNREREVYLDMCRRWRDLPKPTIAMVQGKTIAGGLALAWVCDIIIASEDASFVDPVVGWGVAGIEYFGHPYELGIRKAKELLFTADWWSAEDALKLGMVNHVVPRDELEAFSLAMAERIAQKPMMALRFVKQMVNVAQDNQGMRSTMETTFALHHICHAQVSERTRERAEAEASRERVSSDA